MWQDKGQGGAWEDYLALSLDPGSIQVAFTSTGDEGRTKFGAIDVKPRFKTCHIWGFLRTFRKQCVVCTGVRGNKVASE